MGIFKKRSVSDLGEKKKDMPEGLWTKCPSCAETLFDPDNCNGCGTVCPPVPNALRACLGGSCGRGPCVAGWGDCNPNPADGCETDVTGDSFNCGRCGLVCPPTFGCDAGQCVPMP